MEEDIYLAQLQMEQEEKDVLKTNTCNDFFYGEAYCVAIQETVSKEEDYRKQMRIYNEIHKQ